MLQIRALEERGVGEPHDDVIRVRRSASWLTRILVSSDEADGEVDVGVGIVGGPSLAAGLAAVAACTCRGRS